MESNQKLLDQIKALLRADGYDNITTIGNGTDAVTVSGEKGAGGAMFHLTALRRKASVGRTVGGGRLTGSSTEDAVVAPSIPGLHEQLASAGRGILPATEVPDVLQALLARML
jgi:hypothetical protein